MFDHFDGQTLRFDATKCRLPVAKLYLVATKYVLLLVGVIVFIRRKLRV